MSEGNDFLKWRFDVNTFRLLGRELITDRITAVYELVKNCYDANATKVIIKFENVGPNSLGNSKITISDDGSGMSFSDIENKWMVVGTASKRSNLYSPPPFNRRYVGEKGIGRFAVDRLGGSLKIITKEKSSKNQLVVNINWDTYDTLSKGSQLTLFTDIKNKYNFEPADKLEHGTTLEISSIHRGSVWNDLDIKRLERELEKIISPFYPLNPPFDIYIESNEFPDYTLKKVEAQPIKYSSHQFELNYDENEQKQEILEFDKIKSEVVKKQIDFQSFGPIRLKIFYFNQKAKSEYNKVYKNDDYGIDGFKIYRDGLITTPFAEFESSLDKKRDILGVEKRRWSSAFDKIGTREFIGIVEISKTNNPQIVDSTNRQDFVDCFEYRQLKDFLISQLNVIADLKKHAREVEKENIDIELKKANYELSELEDLINKIEHKDPKLKEYLNPLKLRTKEIDKTVRKGIKQQKKERLEHIRKEKIYRSLMSLQDYAIHISHAIRTSLGNVMRRAEFFRDRFPNDKYITVFKEYASDIYNEMENLKKIIDFMLSYAGSTVSMQDFSVKELLNNLFDKVYEPEFSKENIKVYVEITDNFVLHGNKKLFEDIFANLISNSVKALRNEKDKIIKCTGYIENDSFVLFFSDNGEGIVPGEERKIFELYHTTTADLGGAGFGLYNVKLNIDSLKGEISVVESEFGSKGATFKITFPFKKDQDGSD